MLIRIGAILLLLLLLAGILPPATASAFETRARQAFVIDLSTNSILLNKNADTRMPPASMSKLMTAYLIFERMKSGALKPDDRFTVSRKAWAKGGSKMFLLQGQRVRLESLIPRHRHPVRQRRLYRSCRRLGWKRRSLCRNYERKGEGTRPQR